MVSYLVKFCVDSSGNLQQFHSGACPGPQCGRMVIDIVQAQSQTGQGQVRATRRAPRVPTGPASAVTGKYTINFLVSISLSLLCSLLVPKISSPTLNTVRA